MLIYQIKKNAIVAFLDFVIERSSAVKFSSKVGGFSTRWLDDINTLFLILSS